MTFTAPKTPHLLLRHREREEVVYLHEEPVTGGRATENRLVISDPRVSRFHFRVEPDPETGGWVLVDVGSQNGIVHAGLKVRRLLLEAGTSVRIGGASLVYREHFPEDEAAPPDGGDEGRGTAAEVSEERTVLSEPQAEAEAERTDDVLGRLAGLLRRLCSAPSDEGFPQALVDAAVSLTGSERGFLLRTGEEGMTFCAARHLERMDLERPEFELSWSIAARVGTSGQAVRLLDATRDETFARKESVEALGLRSVLCVPVRGPHGLMGVLYLDNPLGVGVYGAQDEVLVGMLADQAGIAWHHLELQQSLRARKDEVEALAARLRDDVEEGQREIARLRARGGSRDEVRLVGSSARMSELEHLLRKVAVTDFPVLVTGESGTGKELVARRIHQLSERSSRPFVGLNCAAVPESLQESELFGHLKGAFTGADRDRPGLFQAAHSGTLFLDEVSEMSPSMQARLLRALQEKEVRPVGGKDPVAVDARVIAASNRDLEEQVRRGLFREDLYFRLKVLPVRVPPLRERREDIPELVRHFLGQSRAEGLEIDPGALDLLMTYSWPGNVRELENEVKRLSVLAQGGIRREDLSTPLVEAASLRVGSESSFQDLTALVEAVETQEIRKALSRTQGNKTRAADLLGISRFALQRKLDKYGLAGEGGGS